jgi:hypothetical protein
MQVPNFLKLENDSLIYNEDNKEFQFFVDEVFFNDNTKEPIARIEGEYVSMLGICNWCIVDSNGKRSEFKPFCFPTVILCKPNSIEKVKEFKINKDSDSSDYRILHFKKGDEVISQTRVPELIENAELFYKLYILTGKLPNTIDYDKLWELFIENLELTGNSYGMMAQLFGIITAELSRDPKDIRRPFRLTNMNSMNNYKSINVKMLPNYISPYTALISENFDESVMSAIMLSDKDDKDIPQSPLEKVITM